MALSDSDNIFNLATRQSKQKIKQSPVVSKEVVYQAPLKNEDIERLQKDVLKWRKEIEEGLERVYKVTGFTAVSVSSYLDNPANFQPADWQIGQELRKMRREELERLVGEEIMKGAETEKRVRTDKKKKGKSLGARRNWIDMH